MKSYEQFLASTHLDAHNEMLTLGALHDLQRQVTENSIPIILDHDPRCVPLGRTIGARMIELEDGEHALIGKYEIFDDLSIPISEHRIPLNIKNDGLEFGYDITFRKDNSLNEILELAADVGANAKYYGKKAADPLSFLIVAGGIYALGKIADGFFTKLGEDLYVKTKNTIKKLSDSPKYPNRFVLFQFTVETEFGPKLVKVAVETPNRNIERFFDSGIQKLDEELERYRPTSRDIAYFLFIFDDIGLELSHAVRVDGVPTLISERAKKYTGKIAHALSFDATILEIEDE